MTRDQILAQAANLIQQTGPLEEWAIRMRQPGYKWRQTPRGRALILLEQLKNQPPEPQPRPVASVFAGKGLFTTTDASSASNLPADWVAIQKDPEGDPAPLFNNNPGRLMYWMARPTQTVADEANAKKIPFVGQAENQDELVDCLALKLTVPKALVGNPGSWSASGFKFAAENGWDLILEFYANKEPWLTAPNAANYPRFVNVCFGIFPETGATYKPLTDYRAAWTGSFSVWAAEHMLAADRAEFAR